MEKLSPDEILFGQELKSARKGRKITLKGLEKITKISHSYIARIEKGERKPSELVKETLEAWLATGKTGDKFAVTTVFEPGTQKAEYRPITKAILDLVADRPEHEQGEAFALLSKHFSASRKQEKP